MPTPTYLLAVICSESDEKRGSEDGTWPTKKPNDNSRPARPAGPFWSHDMTDRILNVFSVACVVAGLAAGACFLAALILSL